MKKNPVFCIREGGFFMCWTNTHFMLLVKSNDYDINFKIYYL